MFILFFLTRLSYFRYFQCVAMHGLFAPVHKVSRMAVPAAAVTPAMRRGSASGKYSVGSVGGGASNLMASHELSGSQESISSIGSAISSVSRSRVRLGVTAYANQVPHKAFIVVIHRSPVFITGLAHEL